jgi:hypothetical protein
MHIDDRAVNSMRYVTVCNRHVNCSDVCAGEYALAGLFGAVPLDAKDEKRKPLKVHDNVTPATWNSMSQVFPTGGFSQLFEQYKASFLQGGAHVFSATYQVRTCRPSYFHSPSPTLCSDSLFTAPLLLWNHSVSTLLGKLWLRSSGQSMCSANSWAVHHDCMPGVHPLLACC